MLALTLVFGWCLAAALTLLLGRMHVWFTPGWQLRALSVGSSSCSARTPPTSFWYCMARRSMPAEVTGLPSSVKPTAPWSRSSAMSVSSVPFRPRVIAGMKPTGTRASCSAASCRALSSGAESSTGSVLGIAITPQ